MKFLVKFFGYLFGIGAAFALLIAAGVWMYLQTLSPRICPTTRR
jgi:penicillin-binding protein 1A